MTAEEVETKLCRPGLSKFWTLLWSE